MRRWILAGVAVIVGGSAGVASAAPSAEIRDAAIRVTVIPEARSDVVAMLVKTNPRLPIWISRVGDKVLVHGNVGHQISNCGEVPGQPSVGVWMRGRFGYQELPQLIIRTPMDVHLSAGEAVYGHIGHAQSVQLGNSGCGDWTLGDVDGVLRVDLTGSGDLRSGSAGSAAISIAGSGDVTTGPIRAGLGVSVSGSGDLTTSAASGPLNIRLSGSGDVKVLSGQATKLSVSVAGSGDVEFGGVADTLEASVAGSGDVTVNRVTGAVIKHVAGSGDVHIGH